MFIRLHAVYIPSFMMTTYYIFSYGEIIQVMRFERFHKMFEVHTYCPVLNQLCENVLNLGSHEHNKNE